MFDVAGIVHVTRLRRVPTLSIAGDAVVPALHDVTSANQAAIE